LPGKGQAAITAQEACASLSVALHRAEVLQMGTSQSFVDTATTTECQRIAGIAKEPFLPLRAIYCVNNMTEADQLIEKIRSSEFILMVVGAGLSRPSGIPTFRDDPQFWERPVEDSATAAAFERDPLYVWALYERLRLIARNASPNLGHSALARLARAKPRLLTVSQNIDGTWSGELLTSSD
jgi:hypothetical protein